MVRPIDLVFIAAALSGLFGLASCSTRARVRAGAVLPTTSAPGETIILRTTEVGFTTPGEARATVGGVPATVVRVLGPQEAEILVPETKPGSATVVVESGGRSESLPVEVAPNRFQRLVLTVEADRVTLEARQPTSAAPVEARPSEGALLSYEVVSPTGEVIFRGAVENPLYARQEVFINESGRMHQTSPPRRAAVAVIVPIVPAGSVVRFVEMQPMTKAAGRVLGEAPIGGEVR